MKTQSYSAIKMYEQCPAKYKFSRIDKIPEPTGPAAERGKLIHAEIEAVLKGQLELVCDELIYLLPKLDEWRQKNAQSELEFAVDSNWDPVDFSDSNAMFRGVIDLYIEQGNVALILDFKTGKERDYADQVRAYATAILATKPHIHQVTPMIEFIDLQKSTEYATIYGRDIEFMKSDVRGRINIIEHDKFFSANPSGLCKFCHYRKDNGGPCKW
jgi:CRISPR/Cas system-associated exonuclease Cas4 (RecB family)